MMFRLVLRLSSFFGGLAVAMGLLAPQSLAVPTDVILFQDTTDTITQLFNGKPFGTCPVENAGCTTTSEQGGGTGIPTFPGSAFPIAFNIFEDATMKVVSDTFSLSVQDFSGVGGTANTVVATFISDIDGVPVPPLTGPNVFNLVETGIVQDLGTVTFVDANGLPIDAIDYQFVSDVAEVPEPSSLLLQGVGFAAMIGLWRRLAGRQLRRT
jgi:hypothetical protein